MGLLTSSASSFLANWLGTLDLPFPTNRCPAYCSLGRGGSRVRHSWLGDQLRLLQRPFSHSSRGKENNKLPRSPVPSSRDLSIYFTLSLGKSQQASLLASLRTFNLQSSILRDKDFIRTQLWENSETLCNSGLNNVNSFRKSAGRLWQQKVFISKSS